jgi:hypothetical protein
MAVSLSLSLSLLSLLSLTISDSGSHFFWGNGISILFILFWGIIKKLYSKNMVDVEV